LPDFSNGPRGDAADLHRAVSAAGYEGLQGGDAGLCSQFGLTLLGSGLLRHPDQANALASGWKKRGAAVLTCIAGFGMESDAELDAYAAAICQASEDHQMSVLLETHRASITQDAWRTVQLSQRFPKLRFNLDLSHWFTGQEMPYGDLDTRLAFLEPVIAKTSFLHGRVGDRCCMQVPIAEVSDIALSTFRRVWTKVMSDFFSSRSRAETELWFCPELLGPTYDYARQFRNEDGELQEETDRWQEAQVLVEIAKQCFDEVSTSSISGPAGKRIATADLGCSLNERVRGC
jgi:hypothetical protein